MKILHVTVPEARGIGRVSDNERAIILYFDRPLSDDEMRALHTLLKGGSPTVALASEPITGTPSREALGQYTIQGTHGRAT